MGHNYLQQMATLGYSDQNIDDFHKLCIKYLARRYFSDKNARILDIGAGHGHCLFPLKESGYQHLIAADIDDHNRNLFEGNDIQFIHLNAEHDEFPVDDDSIDVVLLFHVIEHLNDPSRLLAEVHRITKRDGVFIMVTPDWRKQYKTFYRDQTHVRPYDKISIERLLRCAQFYPLSIKSFGVLRGLGRTGIWRVIKPLMFSGTNILAVSQVYQHA